LKARERLAEADPQSAQAQRDLSVSLDKLGNVELQAGNLAAACERFQRSLEIAERLAEADPQSAQAAFDLYISHQWLARVAKARAEREEQVHHLNAAKAVLDAMETRGQYDGYAALERARRYIETQLLER
ncbi:MAG: hypothetical protein AB1Z98_17275, partial [Nannocystaceae bacterium]